jgi:AAA15 family ATPase/GTPase
LEQIPRITELRIKNFKSYENAVIRFAPFNVIVGPNASGKTNLVDALVFTKESLYQ